MLQQEEGLRPARLIAKTARMDKAGTDLLQRTVQPRYPNGERKLARDPFMQVTWVILVAAGLVQLVLLLGLDLLS